MKFWDRMKMSSRTRNAQVYRDAVVSMVNVLGAPRDCPCKGCEGCAYERQEAICVGLRALGYLAPNTYKLVEEEHGCRVYDFDGPQPDPLDAWEQFMDKEIGFPLPDGWRDR